ncbi:MAG: hypothetical protein HQ518_15965, partial [Rhodopirellula sp.]|nr:hypothetical protein [Rhodopirellula sp.]
MSVITSSAGDKTSSTANIDSLAQQATQLDLFVRQAAAEGESLDAVERPTFDQALRMATKRKAWMIQPAKKPTVSVSAVLKAEVETKAKELIVDFLNPKHVRPPRPHEQLNYVTDIET